MLIHTYKPIDTSIVIVKRIKYKIWDFGDVCTIAYSATHVDHYRFVDRRQEDNIWIEVLEKMPVGYCPPGDVAICSIVDVGITKDPNVFIYGNYQLTVEHVGNVLGGTVPSIQVLGGTVPSIQVLGGTVPSIQVPRTSNVFEQMSRSTQQAPRNATHTKQFKRKPLSSSIAMLTSIPLVMPTNTWQHLTEEIHDTQKKIKIKSRVPMMSIPLIAAGE